MALAKCARCGFPYDKIRSLVCQKCQPKEDTDYEKIRDTLSRYPDLKVQELADAAEVNAACVLRMVDEGYLAGESLIDPPKCGRCGKRAISRARRLCQACLADLNKQLMESIRNMNAALSTKKESTVFRQILTSTRERQSERGGESRRVMPYPVERGSS